MDDKISKEIEEELKKKGLHISKVSKGVKEDPMSIMMKQLSSKLPLLLDDLFNREKRVKVVLSLTTDEMLRLADFMLKNGFGKAQIMEDP